MPSNVSIINKRTSSAIDLDLFNRSLLRQRLEHAQPVSLLQQPWHKKSPLDVMLGRLFSHPSTIPPYPVAVVPISLPDDLAVRPQYTFATNVISKLSFKEQEDLNRHKAINRWRRIIESDITVSETGRMLEQTISQHAQDSSQINSDLNDLLVSMLEDTFARKSTATLVKRSCDILKFIDWAKIRGESRPLILNEPLVYDYVNSLKGIAGPSCANSFISSLRFAMHTIGLKSVTAALSQRVVGSGQLQQQQRGVIRQARPLTAKQVYLLERTAVEHEDSATRYIAGYLCFCLFSCSRFRDPMFALQWILDEPSPDFGYLESRTCKHKTANIIKKAVFLPMVAFTHGLFSKSWASEWFDTRKSLADDTNDGFGSDFVLPGILRNGQWANRPMTTSEGSAALREILRSGYEDVTGVSTHSLKVTLLSWGAKSNLSVDDRRILGHHIDPHMTSALTYSRDAMAGPLERMYRVIQSIKDGSFLPDESRARRTGRNLGLVFDEPVEETDQTVEMPDAILEAGEEEVMSDTSSDESDVGNDLSPEEEHSILQHISAGRVLFNNEPNVYVHKDSGLGHIMNDDLGLHFACGKQLSPAYRNANQVSYQVHMCLRCKPP